AVQDALSRASGDVLVVADADVIPRRLDRAVTAVTDGCAWATPHRTVARFTADATRRVLDGEDPWHVSSCQNVWDERPYKAKPGGGVVVIRRNAYEQVPLDPRFEGFGGE